jgi:segregation and condensation protein A
MTTAGTLPASWRVCLPIFEGPLDLLLHLVRINQVEITDIPVAKVCDQYYEYLSLMEELDLDIAGEYVYEAAMLIQLKSRLLLPTPRGGYGEPGEDPRQELVERLLEYRRLKEAAQTLAEVDRVRLGVWTRQPGDLRTLAGGYEEEVEEGDLSLFDLLTALKGVLDRYEREHPAPLHVERETFSVREQLVRLVDRLEAGRPLDLLDDLRSLSCRAEAIATFLAVLEMARLQLVRLHQTEGGAVLLHRTTRALRDADLEAVPG